MVPARAQPRQANIAGKAHRAEELGPGDRRTRIVSRRRRSASRTRKAGVSWIFCVRMATTAGDERVTGAVSDALGKALKPDRIVWVGALRRQIGEIVSRAVPRVRSARIPANLSTIENPGRSTTSRRLLR